MMYDEDENERLANRDRELLRGMRDVGLNADWNMSAYALGGGEANVSAGAAYLLDRDGGWEIVRRWYADDNYAGLPERYRSKTDGGNDYIVTIRTFDELPEALAYVRDHPDLALTGAGEAVERLPAGRPTHPVGASFYAMVINPETQEGENARVTLVGPGDDVSPYDLVVDPVKWGVREAAGGYPVVPPPGVRVAVQWGWDKPGRPRKPTPWRPNNLTLLETLPSAGSARSYRHGAGGYAVRKNIRLAGLEYVANYDRASLRLPPQARGSVAELIVKDAEAIGPFYEDSLQPFLAMWALRDARTIRRGGRTMYQIDTQKWEGIVRQFCHERSLPLPNAATLQANALWLSERFDGEWEAYKEAYLEDGGMDEEPEASTEPPSWVVEAQRKGGVIYASGEHGQWTVLAPSGRAGLTDADAPPTMLAPLSGEVDREGEFITLREHPPLTEAQALRWLLGDVSEACPNNPSCPCRTRTEALHTSAAVRSGKPSCGCRHSKLLGLYGDVVERLEAEGPALRVGRPSVNVGAVWRYYTTSVYASADLPVLCVRECLQNALDAIDGAVKHRQVKRDEARFSVTWQADRTLTIEDNGIGMDADTFFGKFLAIGESGKRGAGVSSAEGGKGGFGVAKAVILGTSATFRWKVHTRDSIYVAEGFDEDVKQYAAPFRQGTAIVIYDVSEKFVSSYDYTQRRYVHIAERIRNALALNDLDSVRLSLDGQEVSRAFSRRGGSALKIGGTWGAETDAEVKVYKRADRGGAYYVRLNGLWQFTRSSVRGKMKGDVVVDLSTTVRPDDPRGLPYPLNAARDALTTEARIAFDEVVAYAEQETESLTEQREYDALDPELAETDEERAGSEEVARAAQEAFGDPDVQKAMQDAIGGIADFFREEERASRSESPEAPVTSNAPRGTPASRGPRGFTGATSDPAGAAPASATAALVGRVAGVLRTADEQRVELGGAPGSVLSVQVQSALRGAVETGEIGPSDVALIRRALEQADNAALGPGGGGIIQVEQVAQAWAAFSGLLDPRVRAALVPRNPFGRAAGILISRTRYKRAKSRRFIANYAKWIPYLVAWDGTLRLVANEVRMRVPFAAGFVLDDGVVGLARQKAGRVVVYINPDHFQAAARAHKERPLALAAYLHGLACHELTHANNRMGDGHDEEYIAARERMAAETVHLLPAIAILVQRALRLPETAEQRDVRKLRDRLVQLRSDLGQQRRRADASRRSSAKPSVPGGRDASVSVRTEASDLLDVVLGGLLAAPPAGLDPAYMTSFMRRNRAGLIQIVEGLLEEKRRVVA